MSVADETVHGLGQAVCELSTEDESISTVPELWGTDEREAEMTREEAISWLKNCAMTECEDCKYVNKPDEWCDYQMIKIARLLETEPSDKETKSADSLFTNVPSEDKESECNLLTHEEAWEQIESDLISRADVLGYIDRLDTCGLGKGKAFEYIRKYVEKAECVSAERVGEWIPCSERLPSDDEIVNITWINHNPPPYYAEIAEKPFVASGVHYRGEWYWYSSVVQDLHQEYDLMDKDIEVTAWQPLPTPYCPSCGAKMKGGNE